MLNYNPKSWHFLNMNSPADLYAQYEAHTVKLIEYDGCRDGHALVSDFGMEDTMYFSTEIKEIGQGAAIGLYYGDGCFSDYMLVAASDGKLSVRIPSGVPQGDTFRMKGALRCFEIASKPFPTEKVTKLAFAVVNGRLSVSVNGDTLIRELDIHLPLQVNKAPKIIVKALNETNQQRRAEAVFGEYQIKGIAKKMPLWLRFLEEDGITPWQNGSVHIAGEYERWTRTDSRGEACIDRLPFGKYRLVTGKEEEGFLSHEVIHNGLEQIIKRTNCKIVHRENKPQENLETDAACIGLNGIWSFELDKDNMGEEQCWYLPGNHTFSKCIQVPFSWQSLLAVGEGELANEYTLHQANTFFSTAKEIGEIGWYQRSIHVDWEGETELIFAAVSGVGRVWLNGTLLGCLTDSYGQRTFRLGKLETGKSYTLTVQVIYEHGNHSGCSGKQGFWFTDAPGIWQNVWLRQRENERIHELLVDYEIDEEQRAVLEIKAEVDVYGKAVEVKRSRETVFIQSNQRGIYRLDIRYVSLVQCGIAIKISSNDTVHYVAADAVSGMDIFDTATVYLPLFEGENRLEIFPDREECMILEIKAAEIELQKKVAFQWAEDDWRVCEIQWDEKSKKLISKLCITLQSFQQWSMDDPFLYTLRATVVSNETIGERKAAVVQRKVGLREIGVSAYTEATGTYITVNGEKIYIRGVLDQGYNPWGIYTYPALRENIPGSAVFDIRAAKECGYNLMRMHIKDNEPDWYRICDEEGMLVWDEIPCNFYGTAHDEHWQSMYRRQLKAAVIKHNYHPSIMICATVNESWGISGDHEKSPWDDSLGQKLIKDYAKFYKQNHPYALVIDNSGYAKTSETQILDYHSYPGGFTDAHSFFGFLEKMNYPGSVFNCYHKEHKSLMEKAEIRDLLQRTCAQNLQKINYVGDECQSGQPVILSEFVHTDRQEELIRIFKGFAGYVRMNLASAENEDTSPYTAKRTKRDFGYMELNTEDFLYMDLPFLSKVKESECINVPVYLSLWSDRFQDGDKLSIRFLFQMLTEEGTTITLPVCQELYTKTVKYTPYLAGEIPIVIPKGYTGGYFMAELYCSGSNVKLADTSVQFEIFQNDTDVQKQSPSLTMWNTFELAEMKGFVYHEVFATQERNLIWGYGAGTVVYHIQKQPHCKGVLIFEASTCEILRGTRITDENDRNSQVEVYINGKSIGIREIKQQSTDMRALFSNSSAGEEKTVDYAKTGQYGYGTRVEIPFERLDMTESILTIEITVRERGIVLYGRRMGRYGCDPYIRWES